MAEALHAYTALLPLVTVTEPVAMPGRDTPTAMRAGIFGAVVGGIEALARQLALGPDAEATSRVPTRTVSDDARKRRCTVNRAPRLTGTAVSFRCEGGTKSTHCVCQQ